jgi:hypothetical protein
MVKKKRNSSAMRRLHRSFGAFAAVFVLFMVLSGLALNHSNGLGLDHRKVSQSFLLGWYGLGKPSSIRSYSVGDDWLSFAGSQMYLNDYSVATLHEGIGVVSTNNLYIAASSDEILLLDHDGNLVERIAWAPISTESIKAIGLDTNGAVSVKTVGQVWLADANLLNWQRMDNPVAIQDWSSPQTAPDELQESITHLYRGDGLSLERVLLDLHSGRIFGSVGVLVYDLLALALGFLSLSGLVLWFRSRRNGKKKKT